MTELYSIVGSVVLLYTDLLWGVCFSLYAGRLCGRRTRFSEAWSAVLCAAVRAGLSLLLSGEPDSAGTVVRLLIMIAVSAVCLRAFFVPQRRMGVYAVLSWTAVFELSMFVSYSVVLAADPLYGVFLGGGIYDPEQYAAASQWLAIGTQILTAAFLSVLCIFCCRRIDACFPKHPQALRAAELQLLVLPAGVGILLAVLLRRLMVSISDGVPTLLFDTYPLLRLLVPAIAAVSLVSVVHAAKTRRDMEELEEERRAGLAARERARALREQVEETERTNAHLRKMRHDLRNTLTVIRQLSAPLPGSEELSAYLDRLGQDAAELERPFSTGDAVADVLLAAKSRELANEAPDATLDAAGLLIPKDSGISSYDLGIILGNALDNAIHAVRAGRSAEQFIRLSSVVHGDLLSIRIQNSCERTVPEAAEDGLPMRAGREGQGIGMRAIRDVVQRYDGTVDWKADGKVFTLAVMLRTDGGQSAQTDDISD